jgi:hypothetical protein
MERLVAELAEGRARRWSERVAGLAVDHMKSSLVEPHPGAVAEARIRRFHRCGREPL